METTIVYWGYIGVYMVLGLGLRGLGCRGLGLRGLGLRGLGLGFRGLGFRVLELIGELRKGIPHLGYTFCPGALDVKNGLTGVWPLRAVPAIRSYQTWDPGFSTRFSVKG